MTENLRRLALLLAGTAVALASAEAALRLLPSLASGPSAWSHRPRFYYAPSDALHDYRYSKSKVPGRFRIAVVGDSFSYPYEMQLDDVFAKRLERMLNLGVPVSEPMRAEVLNFGKPGIGSETEVGIVEQALDYQPDLVLLQITLNDPPGASDPQELAETLTRIYRSGAHPWLSHWKSAEFVATRLRSLRMRRFSLKYHHDLFDEPVSWRGFAKALASIRDACASRGVPLAFLLFPLFDDPLDERYPFASIHARIASLHREMGIPLLDLRAAFSDVPLETLWIKASDSHPNEVAHRIASEELYLWLESQGLLPEELRIPRKFSERSGWGVRPFEPDPVATDR